jgi:hypothetical protein
MFTHGDGRLSFENGFGFKEGFKSFAAVFTADAGVFEAAPREPADRVTDAPGEKRFNNSQRAMGDGSHSF